MHLNLIHRHIGSTSMVAHCYCCANKDSKINMKCVTLLLIGHTTELQINMFILSGDLQPKGLVVATKKVVKLELSID